MSGFGPIGKLPITQVNVPATGEVEAQLNKTLDGVTLDAEAEVTGTAGVEASLNKTLDDVTLTARAEPTYARITQFYVENVRTATGRSTGRRRTIYID